VPTRSWGVVGKEPRIVHVKHEIITTLLRQMNEEKPTLSKETGKYYHGPRTPGRTKRAHSQMVTELKRGPRALSSYQRVFVIHIGNLSNITQGSDGTLSGGDMN